MPMPNPRILNAFLDYYYAVKDQKKTTTAYGVLLSVGQAVGVVANHAQERKPKTGEFKSKIKAAKTVDAWINLALEFGAEAREAQAVRGWKEDCDYAKVMHAMRSYIIDTLTRDHTLSVSLEEAIQLREIEVDGDPDPKIRKADDPRKLGLEKIYYLEAEKNFLPKLQRKAFFDKLLELSDLGHRKSCTKASSLEGCIDLEKYKEEIFAKLSYKEGLCPSIPKCYQSTYYVIYFLEEGMKAQTKELTAKKTEMHFSTYIKYLNSHQSDTTDVIAAEIVQNDDDEGHDFPDEHVTQPTNPRQSSKPSAVIHPPVSRPPQPSSTDDTVATLDPPPVRKHLSTPPKPAQTFFDDGRLYPARPSAVSAPQLFSRESERGEEKEDKDGETEELPRSSSPSLRRSGEQDS